jgi:zinc transporter 1/2/3
MIDCHVQSKLGLTSNVDVHGDVEEIVTIAPTSHDHHPSAYDQQPQPQPHEPQSPQQPLQDSPATSNHHHDHSQDHSAADLANKTTTTTTSSTTMSSSSSRSFEEQIAAFLILELGVIFHSVIIGLNLGVAGTEFRTLYPVLVFHQSFEGMGMGARLSVIPFPVRYRLVPWLLCLAYGCTTPIAVAVGLSLRSTYSPDSFTASVVSGVFDSVSAGILLYTGFVELLARDFLFHPERSFDKYRVSFMLCCLYLGIAIMGLLGKWA